MDPAKTLSGIKPVGNSASTRASKPLSHYLAGSRLNLSFKLKPGRNGSTGKIVADGIVVDLERRGESENKISPKPLPTGYAELTVPDETIANLPTQQTISTTGVMPDDVYVRLQPNTGLLLTGTTSRKTALALFKKHDRQLRFVPKPKAKGEGKSVHPINDRQALALAMLEDPAISLVTLYGLAGTGKTVTAILAALRLMGKLSNQTFQHSVRIPSGLSVPDSAEAVSPVNQLVICRAIDGVGGKDLGYLPGSLDEKVEPWGQAIDDALQVFTGGDYVGKLKFDFQITVAPVVYLRGRTLSSSFLLVDDSQNQPGGGDSVVRTLVSRAGEGTKVVFTGDQFQIDTPGLTEQNNGLVHVLTCGVGFEHTACMHLVKGERSFLAEFAAKNL